MQLFWVFNIGDERTEFFWWRSLRNKTICTWLGLFQLIVAGLSLYQHIFSILKHRHVFYCQSNISADASFSEHFLAYDIIIFDYGLMHQILGTKECVANYLDGGYMRGMWCLEQLTALITMYFGLYCFVHYTWMLWPALLIQSSYSLGMVILSMATAPKLLEAIGSEASQLFYMRLFIFIGGMMLNWLFTLVLWHHYWFVDDRLHGRRHYVFEI